MRKAAAIAVALGLGALQLCQPAGAAGSEAQRKATAREDIEWLDVWLPHTNEGGEPRVLLIGDSIARGYFAAVESALSGRAYVSRLSTSKSLGDPALLDEIALVLKDQHFDVIHFNNGLHGSGYSESEYAQALPALVSLLHRSAPRAKLIWASSTNLLQPFAGDHPSLARIIERNRLAAAYAASLGIPVDDLFSVVERHPEYHVEDGVHFTAQGYQALGSQVAHALGRALDAQVYDKR
jgi:GDSL-like lipase/acylhydrolase family protein